MLHNTTEARGANMKLSGEQHFLDTFTKKQKKKTDIASLGVTSEYLTC